MYACSRLRKSKKTQSSRSIICFLTICVRVNVCLCVCMYTRHVCQHVLCMCEHVICVCQCVPTCGTLIFIMTVFFFFHKKNTSSNFGAKAHRFGLCSQRSVSVVFFFMLKKYNHYENESMCVPVRANMCCVFCQHVLCMFS